MYIHVLWHRGSHQSTVGNPHQCRHKNLGGFCHAIYTERSRKDCTFDRLEFLGDAVLDLVAADFRINCGVIPDTASESVDNESLQALFIELGLEHNISNLEPGWQGGISQ